MVSSGRIGREHTALDGQESALGALNARAARARGGKRAEATISRTYMGYSDPPQQFVIATVPPDGARHPAPRGDKD